MKYLAIRVSFLNGKFHGRGDLNTPEWPPSPFRLFQALVATTGAPRQSTSDDDQALKWLSSLPAPTIFAPPTVQGIPYQTSVPNNAMDIVAKAWARRSEGSKDANPATHKTLKTIRPLYLMGKEPNENVVTYLWRLPNAGDAQTQQVVTAVQALASRLHTLGWGIDQVAGHAQLLSADQADQHPGDRWAPVNAFSNSRLRCPTPASLQHLRQRHDTFLRRLQTRSLAPVPPISPAAFFYQSYLKEYETVDRPIAAFSLIDLDGSRMRAFRPNKGCSVAGMIRHALANAAQLAGWNQQRIAEFVLGHVSQTEQKSEAGDDNAHIPVGPARIAYVPLPSLEKRSQDGEANHAGLIRRAILFVPAGGHQEQLHQILRILSGKELIDERSGQPVAFLSALPKSDNTVTRYIRASATWSTVTPVILPGRDDRREKKTENLLRKAIRQAGFSDSLAQHAEIDWSPSGFWPGAEIADRYFVPDHLMGYPRFHVRIRWRNAAGEPVEIPGPIVMGGGRYYGIGLFASDS